MCMHVCIYVFVYVRMYVYTWMRMNTDTQIGLGVEVVPALRPQRDARNQVDVHFMQLAASPCSPATNIVGSWVLDIYYRQWKGTQKR